MVIINIVKSCLVDYISFSRYGKGSPEMMQRVASMLLKKYTSSNNSTFKKHLHDLGIGMDCSGYVSRALSFVMEKLRIDKETQLKTLGKGYDGKLKSNATTIRVNVKEDDKAQTKQKWYLSPKSGSTLLVYEPKTINSKELETIEDLQSTYTFTNKNTLNTVDKILKLKLVKITHSTNDKTGIDKIHIVSVSDENISKDITKLQPGDIMTTTSSEGYFHIRLIYEADGKGGFFKHHQSGSENRQGVVETYVDNSNISKQTQNYWFARPNVFKDPKKLRGFFIEMLKYKGGST